MIIDRVICLMGDGDREPVVVQQGDNGSRAVRLLLLESIGVPYDMAGKTAKMIFRKNGVVSEPYQMTLQTDGRLLLKIPEKVTRLHGTGELQVIIEKNGYTLYSFLHPFIVKPSLYYNGEKEEIDPMILRVPWAQIFGKPSVFPPTEHRHDASDVDGLPTPYVLPAATETTLGGIKVGTGLSAAADGTLSATNEGTAADSNKLGGVAASNYVLHSYLAERYPNFRSYVLSSTSDKTWLECVQENWEGIDSPGVFTAIIARGGARKGAFGYKQSATYGSILSLNYANVPIEYKLNSGTWTEKGFVFNN